MSQEREVIKVTAAQLGKETPQKSTQEDLLSLPREELVARLASVLDRGMTNVRLNVELPNDIYGCWVSRDQSEIYRMEALGFKVDDEYAKKNSLHTDGSGKAIVGDVLFMTAPRVIKEAIDEANRRKYIEVHGDPKDRKRLHAEEKAYQARLESAGGVPATVSSKEESVNLGDIAATIAAK